MQLMGVRSSTPDGRLVAVLVEDGGRRVLAVPVAAREGLLLSVGQASSPSTWTELLESCLRACGSHPVAVELDVDADARLVARVHLEPVDAGAPLDVRAARGRTGVDCAPGDGLVLAVARGLIVVASDDALRLRAVDLGEDAAAERVVGWRGLYGMPDTRG